jgi:hypothetical protein
MAIAEFHLQDGLLFHLGHLCVPSSKLAKLIWESHYSQVEGHFGVERTMKVLYLKYLFGPKLQQDVSKYIISFIAFSISKPTIKNKGMYTPLPTPKRP